MSRQNRRSVTSCIGARTRSGSPPRSREGNEVSGSNPRTFVRGPEAGDVYFSPVEQPSETTIAPALADGTKGRMDPSNPQAVHEAIKEALLAGRKIAAIKLYREHNHVGLAQAKADVEKLEAGLGITPRSATSSPLAGCVVLLFVFAAFGLGVWKVFAWWHGQPGH